MSQMEKTFKHARAGSFGTRARYKSSCTNFISFLDEKFKMKNLRNLQDKHVVAYIEMRQETGIAPKTIKNDLGAIRYMHDILPNVKHDLSSNKDLKKIYGTTLEKTPAVKGNRGWTKEEYQNMHQFADETGSKTSEDVRDIMVLSRTMGLRVTEAVAMHRSQAEQALRSGVYQVKSEAKNGKWRQVRLSSEAREMMIQRLNTVERGERLFIQSTEKTHQAVNRVEKFMQHHRTKFETEEGKEKRLCEGKSTNLTYHGLRYSYVQNRLEEEMRKGFTYEQAAQRITKEVGHERIDVIKVYLGN